MTEVFIDHNIENWQRALERLPEDVLMRAMKQTAQTTKRELLRRFRRTVGTWRHRPRFEVIEEITPTGVSVLAGTDDKVYRYVDQGTRPHIIEPRGPGYPLRFKSGYAAKTQPGVLGSGQGGPSGPYVHAWRVQHPGTQARRFTELILKEMVPITKALLVKLIHKQLIKHARWAARR